MTCTVPAQQRLIADGILRVLSRIDLLPRRLLLATPGVAATVPMLRGVWGAALHSLSEPAYRRVFEGYGGPGQNAPHEKTPLYVLRPAPPDPEFAPAMDWILIGDAVRHDEVLAGAWHRAAAMGLGPQRQPFSLVQGQFLDCIGRAAEKGGPWHLGQCGWPCEQPETTPCELRFDSPLRLRRRGQLIEQPALVDLVVAATRRVATFLPAADVDSWQSLAERLHDIARRMPQEPWQGARLDLTRYSGRQRRELDLHGVCGRLALPTGPGPLWPLLSAACWLHLGKGTVMGLGQPHIVPIEEA